MREPMEQQCYNEEWFQERGFEFDVDVSYFRIITKTLVEKFKPRSVLDVGCAKGHLVYCFNELGVEAYGVDISKYAISQSPESVRAALFNLDVEFEELPFEPETFDIVVAIELVEHLQNHNYLISEMKRVLTPGGVVFITTPKRYREFLFRIINMREPTHINLHSKPFWIRTFENQGFHYTGNFPRDAHKDALHARKNAVKKVICMRPPRGKTAPFLLKFGEVGKWLGEELATAFVLLPSEALLFRS